MSIALCINKTIFYSSKKDSFLFTTDHFWREEMRFLNRKPSSKNLWSVFRKTWNKTKRIVQRENLYDNKNGLI